MTTAVDPAMVFQKCTCASSVAKFPLLVCCTELGFGFVGFHTEDAVQKICAIRFHQVNGKTV